MFAVLEQAGRLPHLLPPVGLSPDVGVSPFGMGGVACRPSIGHQECCLHDRLPRSETRALMMIQTMTSTTRRTLMRPNIFVY